MKNTPTSRGTGPPGWKGNRFSRAFFSAAGVILVSKAMGFVKQVATAPAFGADALSGGLIYLPAVSPLLRKLWRQK